MAFNQKKKPRVIVKEIKRRPRSKHHAGTWKIAYADFVTAMMAFFLLMWTVTTFNKSQIVGIAHYFNNPLTIPRAGGQGHGDRDAVIHGSGSDITRKQGQVSRGHPVSQGSSVGEAHAHPRLPSLAQLKGKLERSLAKNNLLSQFRPQIAISSNQEGVQLQIVDARQQPLFAGDSARLTPSAEAMLKALGRVLSLQPNRISIEGHTGAAPYAGPKRHYSNWALSLDQANACRRALRVGGFPAGRILRVAGLASVAPLFPAHPMDPRNRRISITLLTQQAARAIETQASGGLTLRGDKS